MRARKPEKTWPKMTANIGAVAKAGQSKYIKNIVQDRIREKPNLGTRTGIMKKKKERVE
jgi:hypothetical protein